MGKIVKYCNTCEESFAEKFSFCPICGEPINAFEMKPVGDASKLEEIVPDVPEEPITIIKANEVVLKPLDIKPIDWVETVAQGELSETIDLLKDGQPLEFGEPEIALELDEQVDFSETLPIAKPYFSASDASSGMNGERPEESYQVEDAYQPEETHQSTIDYSDFEPIDTSSESFDNRSNFYDEGEDDFHVTVLTEKNVKERNMLLLGTMVLMLALCVGVVIGSIFNHPLLVGAIGDDDLVAFVPIVDEVPMTVEEEKQKLNDEEGGGGGGGGREEQTPTSKGRLANQTPDPLINPDVSIIQRKAELQQPVASTQGDQIRTPTDERYGDPNSLYDKLSNGLGRGGGQGSGEGTGQGSGRGTGEGSGTGSGSGSGIGDGRGGGTGTGTGGGNDSNPPERIQKPAGPSAPIKFISKPQPKYTDAARQNNIQGQVVLRITFLSNGQIGSISAVSGLSYGLTEQAIAAARQIRFEPAMKNGQPYSVSKSVQYTFTIY